MQTRVKETDYYICKGICGTRNIIQKGLCMQIGRGNQILALPWLILMVEGMQQIAENIIAKELSNSDGWNCSLINTLFDENHNFIIRNSL